MELIQPWKTQIGKINVAHLIDVDELAQEILSLHCLTHNDDHNPHQLSAETTPVCVKFRDEVCTPLVKDYIRQAFDFEMEQFRIDTFGKWFKPGQELGAHYHGDSCITTIFYPQDTDDRLMAYDPRGNACRGYPRQIRDNYFGNAHFNPRKGDLWIIPSYVQHSVATVQDELRLSLINDYFISQK